MSSESVINKVTAYLLNGGTLTVKSCWMMFGTTEMRKIASRLRKRGHKVATREVTGTANDGREVRFNEYRIIKEA